MQIYVPNNLSRDQILGSLINDATFVFGDIINQDQVVLKFMHFDNTGTNDVCLASSKLLFVITYSYKFYRYHSNEQKDPTISVF